MATIGMILLVIGLVVMLVGGIWLLVVAFKESIWWGLGSLFIPFVSLIFAIMHWSKASKPFLIAIGGMVVYFIGIFMSGALQGMSGGY